MTDLEKIAKESRIKVLELVWKAQTSHIGSLFSCAEIMTALFEKIDFKQDLFVLSAGWKAAMLYYHLWRKGRMTLEELNSFCMPGSKYIGLTEPVHPDIKIAGGSMGLGLPGAVGLALAKKLNHEPGKVYVLMSDGEMQCGTTWECMLLVSTHRLNNLVVIVDNNGLQAMGKNDDIVSIRSIRNHFKTENWLVLKTDGHNADNLFKFLDNIPQRKPILVQAKTIKGKGVSFMENNNLWHYAHLTDLDYQKALAELNA